MVLWTIMFQWLYFWVRSTIIWKCKFTNWIWFISFHSKTFSDRRKRNQKFIIFFIPHRRKYIQCWFSSVFHQIIYSPSSFVNFWIITRLNIPSLNNDLFLNGNLWILPKNNFSSLIKHLILSYLHIPGYPRNQFLSLNKFIYQKILRTQINFHPLTWI